MLEVFQSTAKGTVFENSLKLVSGTTFPDIVAKVNEDKYYGIEVKSTTQNHWQTIGNSVLESCRFENVDRIYIMFGKLADPIEFRSRPYEECLSGVSVTHYPRYRIDMNLERGHTIFDKIKSTYDEVRNLDNPIAPFSQYYRSQLKEGESLWWLGDAPREDINDNGMKIRLWKTLDKHEKDLIKAKAMVYFPEIIMGKSTVKYERYVLWLVTEYGIVCSNVRDDFTAGGKVDIFTKDKVYNGLPQIFNTLNQIKDMVLVEVLQMSIEKRSLYWKENIVCNDLINGWLQQVEKHGNDVQGYNVGEVIRGILGITAR